MENIFQFSWGASIHRCKCSWSSSQGVRDMAACLGVGAFPELHVRARSATGVVESGVVRSTLCVGLGKGKGFGAAGRVSSVESGKFFLKGKGHSQELVRRAVGAVTGETKERREVTSMALSINDEKRITGAGGAVLEDVPHLTDWLPDLPVRILV